MGDPKSLSWAEQAQLLRDRGMIVTDRDEQTLRSVSYYRIKEFAKPFSVIHNGKIDYQNTTFEMALKRYYQDKNLRIHLLHAIEQIEVALKTRLSYILGDLYGPFGYLDFYRWFNRKKYQRPQIKRQEHKFKKQLLTIVTRSSFDDLKDPSNLNDNGFPTVWLAIDSLTLGAVNMMVSHLSVTNRNKLASEFNCSGEELVSWVKCLNFIRNVCAHNANILDIQVKTGTKIRPSWKPNLFVLNRDTPHAQITNRISVTICIVVTLVNSINSHYKWDAIQSNLNHICSHDDRKAHLIGFSNCHEAIDLKQLSKACLTNLKGGIHHG